MAELLTGILFSPFVHFSFQFVFLSCPNHRHSKQACLLTPPDGKRIDSPYLLSTPRPLRFANRLPAAIYEATSHRHQHGRQRHAASCYRPSSVSHAHRRRRSLLLRQPHGLHSRQEHRSRQTQSVRHHSSRCQSSQLQACLHDRQAKQGMVHSRVHSLLSLFTHDSLRTSRALLLEIHA